MVERGAVCAYFGRGRPGIRGRGYGGRVLMPRFWLVLLLVLAACADGAEDPSRASVDPVDPVTEPASAGTAPSGSSSEVPEGADSESQPVVPEAGDGATAEGGSEPEPRDEAAELAARYAGDPRLERFDPLDLRVIDAERQMVAAERALARRIAAGEFEGQVRHVEQEVLEDWDYDDGLKGMPEAIRALDGTEVMMLGFIYPVDETLRMTEWMLVPSLWACCYGTPPDVHGAVRVVMPQGQTLDHSFDPVQVIGTLRVSETRLKGYCMDVFQLEPKTIERMQ